MLERLYPYINFGLRRLGFAKQIQDAASEVIVLQPEEVEELPAILHLSGQIAKITAACPGTGSLEAVLEALEHNTPVHHPPVLRYVLRNCLVHAAGFETPGFYFRVQKFSHGDNTGRIEEIPSALYPMTFVSHLQFGHWINDACASALLRCPQETLLLEARPDWPHVRAYVEALGLTPRPPGRALVEELAWHQDHGQGSSKRARYALMRERLAAAFASRPGGAKAIYLRRGGTGVARLVANEAAVMEELGKRGFEILDATASVEQIHATCRNADIVVSVEGSHMNHLSMAMRAGTGVVALIPADRFILVQSEYAHAVGLRFGFVVMEPTQGGYHVDTGDLLRTIDLMAP